ncbi:MAG: ABC transporter substrate-binding protein [Coriobacteriia bacterium]|nr:ABC transporter substrate-binding protein [Coriobacteriia bacterium]
MSERLRKSIALLLVLGLAFSVLGLAGCRSEEEPPDSEEPVSEGPVEGGTFSFYISEPAFIDPVNLQESEGTQVGHALFDSLVTFDPITSEVGPAAAETWESNEDATVWTFNLVAGAKFHNGRDVTAADFKYAWERICNPENESEIAYHLGVVEGYDEMQDGSATELAGVVAVDDTTLEVTLQYPFADFEYVVGHPALAPVPAEEVEAGDFGEMPIGNGPFMMSEPWAHDQYIKVEKFADYYGDKPWIDAIEYKILADQDTAFLEFQAGNVDFVQIPSGQIQATVDQYGESPDGYTANPGEQVLLGTELATYYILMNNTDEVLSDPVVRQALSLAIDRQAICDTVFEGSRIPATGIVPEGIFGFKDDAWAYSRYDAEEAAELLAEAGYPDGEGLPTIQLQFNSGAGHEDIMQLIQQDFAAIGVESELSGMEWAQYLDMLSEGTYQMGRLGWIADYPIMDNFLYPLFKSGSGDNFALYENAEVDEKLEEARRTVDDDERVELYAEIEKIIGDEAAVAPVMFYRHTRVASDRVMDGVYSANGLFDFVNVWLEQ